MFSKRNFGLTDSLIEVSKKVSEDYQEKVKGLMAKMGIKSLKDLSPEEKKKFFNKLDDMHTAKHEEVELDEAKVMGKEVYDKNFANKTQADNFAKKVGGRVRKVGRVFYVFKEEVDLDEAKKKGKLFLYDTEAEARKKAKEVGGKVLKGKIGGRTKQHFAVKVDEAEQVDELKSKTLKSYISKAGKDLSKRVADYHSKDIASSPSKINKRGLAIDKAKGRLSMNRQLGRSEEVEQVDEISKDLAKSYAKKSMKDIAKKQHSTGTVNTSKRLAGLDRARKRIFKEEDILLDEAKGVIKGFKTNKQKQSYISLAKQVGLKVKEISGGIELSGRKGEILDLQLATRGDLQTEEFEQIDEMFSDAQIKLLQKKYEPLRGKKVSLDNLKKLDKILEPISGNKKALEKLYQADVPFISTKASGILIMKHKYKAPDLMKIKGQVEQVEEGVGDKHQEKIAIDTLKNPKKALLGGMSVSDAEKVLKTKFKYSDAQIKKLKEDESIDEKNFGQPNQPDHYRHMGNKPLQRKKVKPGCEDLDLEKVAGELSNASKTHKKQSEKIKKHLDSMKNERTLTPDEEEKKEKIVMSLKDKAADFEKRYPGKGKQVMYAVATKMAKKD